jgi:hypothetical protein
MTIILDWSGHKGAPLATVGPLAPCRHCGHPALLRHPVTKEPCHKTCEERLLTGTSRTPSTLKGAA